MILIMFKIFSIIDDMMGAISFENTTILKIAIVYEVEDRQILECEACR